MSGFDFNRNHLEWSAPQGPPSVCRLTETGTRRRPGRAQVAVRDGRLVVIGGNWLTRRLLARRTRAEILKPERLPLSPPVIYGKPLDYLERWHEAAFYNEQRRAAAARWRVVLDDLGRTVEEIRRDSEAVR